MRARTLLVCLPLFSCSSDEKPAPLSFTYGEVCACDLSTPALVGGLVDFMLVTPTRPTASVVRVDENQAEILSAKATPSCGIEAALAAPRADESCPSGLTSYDVFTPRVRPKLAGPITLELVDEQGSVLGRTTFPARDAADLTILDADRNIARTSYGLRVGDLLTLGADAKDSDGRELLQIEHSGVTFSWDDTTIMEPVGPATAIGYTGVARRVGATQLTIAARGVVKTVRVNVTE